MKRRDREEKQRDKIKLGMSLLIVFLMVFSAFAVLIGSSSNELRYGKFKFAQDPTYGFYTTKINGQEVNFYSLPSEVYYLNITNASIEKIKTAAYILTTFDPTLANASLQQIELARFDFSKFIPGKVIHGVQRSAQGYEQMPILDCANSTYLIPVLVFNVTDSYGAVDAGGCVYLNGKGYDFLKLRDRILYSYYGVI